MRGTDIEHGLPLTMFEKDQINEAFLGNDLHN
jgi:hypothetical protein